MAEYKKKRVGSVKKSKNKKQYSDSYDVIEFTSKKNSDKKTSVKKPKVQLKNYRPTRWFVAFLLIFVLIISYAVTYIVHPVGVIEYINSVYTSIGSSGGYDIEISGGKPNNLLSDGNKFFLLTDTTLNCYNKNGKTVFEKSHNYSNPVVKSGDTRYIFYDQGEKEISLCTLDKTLYKQTFDNGIICAAVSDAGGYAVATKADGYDSSVTVFNKNNKKIYEWFSTDETVNSIALSKNGKRLAVATLKVENGKFVSSIYVFKFNSANPILSFSYTDEVVYNLEDVSGSVFCATFANNIEFINYKSEAVRSNPSEYSVSIVKQFSNRVIAVRTVAANQDESLVEIYRSNGKLISSFKVNSYVTDFSYKSGNLFLLGLSQIYQYNTDGKLLKSGDASYDAMFIDAVSSDRIACVRNSVIEKTILSSSEE